MSKSKEKLGLLQMAHRAERCFPGPNNRVQVNHTGALTDYRPADEFFSDEDFNQNFVNLLFSPEGVWHYQYTGDKDLASLSPLELNKVIRETVHEIYELANGSLDKSSDLGFNRHDEDHIDNVLNNALEALGPILDAMYLEIIEAKSADEKRQKMEEFEEFLFELVCVARGHDLGNILSRYLHAVISPNMFETIFKGLLKGRMRRGVRRGMMLHNEPVALELIKSWNSPDMETTLQRMRTDFGLVTLGVIDGDKRDLGRKRITYLMHTPSDETQDKHLQVNLYLENQGLTFSADKKEVTWSLDFTPTLSTEEQALLAPYSINKGDDENPRYKAWVPSTVHADHQEKHISHADYAESLFWSLYWPRTKLAIMSLFALYPDLEVYNIKIVDRDTEDMNGRALYTSGATFYRDRLEAGFAFIEKKFALKSKPKEAPSEIDTQQAEAAATKDTEPIELITETDDLEIPAPAPQPQVSPVR
jgi:hypothetical protein